MDTTCCVQGWYADVQVQRRPRQTCLPRNNRHGWHRWQAGRCAGAGSAVAAGSSGPQSERAGDRRFLIRLSLDRRAGRGVQSHRAPRPFPALSARPAKARSQAAVPRRSYH